MPSGSSIYGFSVQMVLLYFLCQITCFASKRLGQKKKKKRGLFHIAKAFRPPRFECLAIFVTEARVYWLYELFFHISPPICTL